MNFWEISPLIFFFKIKNQKRIQKFSPEIHFEILRASIKTSLKDFFVFAESLMDGFRNSLLNLSENSTRACFSNFFENCSRNLQRLFNKTFHRFPQYYFLKKILQRCHPKCLQKFCKIISLIFEKFLMQIHQKFFRRFFLEIAPGTLLENLRKKHLEFFSGINKKLYLQRLLKKLLWKISRGLLKILHGFLQKIQQDFPN